MTLYRVRTLIGQEGAVGFGLATHYFSEAASDQTTANNVNTAVGNFWNDLRPAWWISLTVTTFSEVDVLDLVTGAVLNRFTVTPVSRTGTVNEDPMPLAIQGLIRLRTPLFHAGRRLQGHINVPRPTEGLSTSGAPTAAYQTTLSTAAANLIADVNTTWSVWSRTHGDSAGITSASVAPFWAVLRSRRDA